MLPMRDALIRRFDWFVHTTKNAALPSIRSEGLRPTMPDGYFLRDLPDVVREAIGQGAERVVVPLARQGADVSDPSTWIPLKVQ
jgi:hypothetical protein